MKDNDNVCITYSEYSNNPIIKEVKFELIQNMLLKLRYDCENKDITICMADLISDNTELEGKLDIEKINVLLRVLSQLRNQIANKLR